MTKHQLEEIHRYTKYRVVEALIKQHNEGNTLNSLKEVEEVAEEVYNCHKIGLLERVIDGRPEEFRP